MGEEVVYRVVREILGWEEGGLGGESGKGMGMGMGCKGEGVVRGIVYTECGVVYNVVWFWNGCISMAFTVSCEPLMFGVACLFLRCMCVAASCLSTLQWPPGRAWVHLTLRANALWPHSGVLCSGCSVEEPPRSG